MAGHLLVLAAFLTCLRLGWWQWGRTQETTGTAQNFGYALLWPAFGVAFIYMWVRFLHLEVLKDVEDDEDTERGLRELLDQGLSEHDGVGGADPANGVSPDGSTACPPAGSALAGPRGPRGSPVADSGPDTDLDAVDDDPELRRRRDRLAGHLQKPSQGITIAVATVNGDDEDDPELTAYNQALAALAERERRRAR